MVKYAIIVAGGKGLRMGTEVPKQFLDLGGKPVLVRTLEAFHQFDSLIKLILVLPEDHISYWQHLSQPFISDLNIKLVAGGETRFHSVRNGLQGIKDEGLVAVHDAVRPLIDSSTIKATYESAALSGAAISVVRLKDSIRKISGSSSEPVPRDAYRLVQTPQVFHAKLLRSAYEQEYQSDFTDDASVVQQLGHPIALVDGNYLNIKITTPEDLALAKTYFNELA